MGGQLVMVEGFNLTFDSPKHFHIYTGRSTEGADNIQAAKKLAADGKIKTYSIV